MAADLPFAFITQPSLWALQEGNALIISKSTDLNGTSGVSPLVNEHPDPVQKFSQCELGPSPLIPARCWNRSAAVSSSTSRSTLPAPDAFELPTRCGWSSTPPRSHCVARH